MIMVEIYNSRFCITYEHIEETSLYPTQHHLGLSCALFRDPRALRSPTMMNAVVIEHLEALRIPSHRKHDT